MTLSICLGFPPAAGEVGSVEERLRSFIAGLELGGTVIEATPDDVEPLMLADIAVVDLSSLDPSYLYAVGTRHGRGHGCTIALCEASVVDRLPFALGMGALVPYARNPRGGLRSDSAAAVRIQLKRSIERYVRHGVETVDPTLRALLFDPGRPAARKLDEFIASMHRRVLGPVGRDASTALGNADEAAREELRFLLSRRESDGYGLSDLIALFIAFREAKGWQDMVDLAATLPVTVRDTPMVREQTALALNRLAEATDDAEARAALIERALAEIDAIPTQDVTSETCGIRGRVYKGMYNRSKDPADLAKAIDAYGAGLRFDPRDIYPGINAVTLAFGSPDHRHVVDEMLPVVRFSRTAATPTDGVERYWHSATGIELALMAGDGDGALAAAAAALSNEDEDLVAGRQDWMIDTTLGTLRRMRGDWPGDVPPALDEVIARLEAAKD